LLRCDGELSRDFWGGREDLSFSEWLRRMVSHPFRRNKRKEQTRVLRLSFTAFRIAQDDSIGKLLGMKTVSEGSLLSHPFRRNKRKGWGTHFLAD
jgi:hypothetical protein